MTEVERVAEEMYVSAFAASERVLARERWRRGLHHNPRVRTAISVAARYHLSALRRARGKSLGYVEVNAPPSVAGSPYGYYVGHVEAMPRRQVEEDIAPDALLARVVLVKRPRAGRKGT